MPDMTKKKKQPSDDRHLSTFMVRLPEVFREQLNNLRKETRRSITAEVQIALEEYLRKHGRWPPPDVEKES